MDEKQSKAQDEVQALRQRCEAAEARERELLDLKCRVGDALGTELQQQPFHQAVGALRARVSALEGALADLMEADSSEPFNYNLKCQAEERARRLLPEKEGRDG